MTTGSARTSVRSVELPGNDREGRCHVISRHSHDGIGDYRSLGETVNGIFPFGSVAGFCEMRLILFRKPGLSRIGEKATARRWFRYARTIRTGDGKSAFEECVSP